MSQVLGFEYHHNTVFVRMADEQAGEVLVPNELLTRVLNKQAERLGMPTPQLIMILNEWVTQPEGPRIIPSALHLTPDQFAMLKSYLGVE